MGTSYYFRPETCSHCGYYPEQEEIHIGKSSSGWTFALHVIPELDINSLSDWIEYIVVNPNYEIYDEYGTNHSLLELLRIITIREGKNFNINGFENSKYYSNWDDFHNKNNSKEGPNNLLRRQLSYHCVGYGSGTWDYCKGEFS